VVAEERARHLPFDPPRLAIDNDDCGEVAQRDHEVAGLEHREGVGHLAGEVLDVIGVQWILDLFASAIAIAEKQHAAEVVLIQKADDRMLLEQRTLGRDERNRVVPIGSIRSEPRPIRQALGFDPLAKGKCAAVRQDVDRMMGKHLRSRCESR
jgi:hypothetical protein